MVDVVGGCSSFLQSAAGRGRTEVEDSDALRLLRSSRLDHRYLHRENRLPVLPTGERLPVSIHRPGHDRRSLRGSSVVGRRGAGRVGRRGAVVLTRGERRRVGWRGGRGGERGEKVREEEKVPESQPRASREPVSREDSVNRQC